MSYCRWSSMNWMCDVYVYADVSGGYTTHIASRRRAFPPIPDIPFNWMPDWHGEWDKETRKMIYPTRRQKIGAYSCAWIWAKWHRLSMWSLSLIPVRNIGLPLDGESFNDPTADACADRLESIRCYGYNVPDYAIAALREENDDEHD